MSRKLEAANYKIVHLLEWKEFLRPYDVCTVFAFYVKIYAHRLAECTMRQMP